MKHNPFNGIGARNMTRFKGHKTYIHMMSIDLHKSNEDQETFGPMALIMVNKNYVL
ncbi:hypothetical protein HanRHA438_Chr10g0451501 [Helianthus annuus]|nr:hypothetical protein HanIR_Chr10g0473591 [Helianthus annuus]KAJ0879439.1 hypothetical protein HanRHA438_Chr10g0451501 [Helianthus annuus]